MSIPAVVRHITKNHITITPAKDYDVTVFNVIGTTGDVEAIVAADDGSETIRLLITAPAAGQKMQIKRDEASGVINIIYTTEGKDHV